MPDRAGSCRYAEESGSGSMPGTDGASVTSDWNTHFQRDILSLIGAYFDRVDGLCALTPEDEPQNEALNLLIRFGVLRHYQ